MKNIIFQQRVESELHIKYNDEYIPFRINDSGNFINHEYKFFMFQFMLKDLKVIYNLDKWEEFKKRMKTYYEKFEE